MDPLTIIALIEALIKFAGDVPALVTAGETAVGLLQPGAAAPTDAEMATIAAGLDAAHDALQNS